MLSLLAFELAQDDGAALESRQRHWQCDGRLQLQTKAGAAVTNGLLKKRERSNLYVSGAPPTSTSTPSEARTLCDGNSRTRVHMPLVDWSSNAASGGDGAAPTNDASATARRWSSNGKGDDGALLVAINAEPVRDADDAADESKPSTRSSSVVAVRRDSSSSSSSSCSSNRAAPLESTSSSLVVDASPNDSSSKSIVIAQDEGRCDERKRF